MIWPPSLLRFWIRIEKRRFGLWLPVFLMWPLFLVAALAMLPLVILLSILLWPSGWGRTMLFTGPWLFRMFCALRGVEIDVESGTSRIWVVIR